MRVLLFLIVIWSITACNSLERKEFINNSEQKQFVPPAGWKRIDECFTEFYVPSDMEEKKPYYVVHYMGKGCIKAYGNENVWLNFLLTKSDKVNDFSNQLDFRMEKITVDGRQGELILFTGTEMVNEAAGKNYVAVMYVPRTHNEEGLNMWAYSKSVEDRENAMKIFKSVRFLKK